MPLQAVRRRFLTAFRPAIRVGFGMGLLLLGATAAQAACELNLAYTQQHAPPYLMGDSMSVPASRPGIAVEIIREAASLAGCTLKLSRLPGKRVLAEAGLGHYDGAFMFSYNPERAATLVYPGREAEPDATKRLATLRHHLYRVIGSKLDWDGSMLKNPDNGVIGVNLGFAVAEDLIRQGAKVEEAVTTEQNLNKLKMGRIAGYAMQDNIADLVLQHGGYSNIEKLPKPLNQKDYYLMFSKPYYQRNTALAEQIWHNIGELRDRRTRELLPQYLD